MYKKYCHTLCDSPGRTEELDTGRYENDACCWCLFTQWGGYGERERESKPTNGKNKQYVFSFNHQGIRTKNNKLK